MKKPSLPDASLSFKELVDHVQNEIGELRHLAHLLDGNIDRALDIHRGSTDEYGTVTLRFQKDGIFTTTWLAGKIWAAIAELDDYLIAAHNARCEAERRGEAA